MCLVNDPRNPYNRLLTVEYLSNMMNGRLVLYNNQSVDVLKKLAAASLRDHEVMIISLVRSTLSKMDTFGSLWTGENCSDIHQIQRQNHFLKKRELIPPPAEISCGVDSPSEEVHLYLESSTCQLAINKCNKINKNKILKFELMLT